MGTEMASVRLELQAPDISKWAKGSHGIRYAWTYASNMEGPHVWVNVLTHGNEICGAIVVDKLLTMLQDQQAKLARGKLTLSFANIEAYLSFDPTNPYASRFVDEDLNRVWLPQRLHGNETSIELNRARELLPIVNEADLLLDIHSMLEPSPPVMICGPLEKGIELSKKVGIPHWIVSDKGHANGTRLRDFGGFGEPASSKNALLVECGQHWEKAAEAVAWQTMWRFFQISGAFSEGVCVNAIKQFEELTPIPATTRVIEVTEAVIAHSSDFRFVKAFSGLEVLANQGDVIAYDGSQPVVTPYNNCVLIMPVPNNIKQGLTAVRLGRIKN